MSFVSQILQSGSANNTGSVISLPNSSDGVALSNPVPGNPNFIGGWVSAEKYAVIQLAIRSNTNCDLIVVQAFEPIDTAGVEEYVYNYTDSGSQQLDTVYYYITCPWVKVYVENQQSGNTIFQLSTKLSLTPPPPASTVQPVSGTVAVSNFPATQAVSGTVAVSSQPHLSYLTDNVAVATMPSITGTVAVSSQPYLSYLTDNVAVATMPSITGTVAVSSQPYLSYLTDNVAVATMPSITGTVAVSTIGSGNNVIGKVLTFENPSSAISLTGLGNVGQTIKASAGSLFNITVFNDGNAISYVKLYDVAVPTAGDTPVMTFPVLHDSPINTISIHNYQFSTAIGVRATANYIANDTTAPNGTTSITAFFNGLSP